MYKQIFTRKALELLEYYNPILIENVIKNDWYGERRKYFIDTLYGKLYFTVIDQPFVPMRWHENFDRTAVERLFGVKPTNTGLWNIRDEDPELVQKELELRLSVLTYKRSRLKKAA